MYLLVTAIFNPSKEDSWVWFRWQGRSGEDGDFTTASGFRRIYTLFYSHGLLPEACKPTFLRWPICGTDGWIFEFKGISVGLGGRWKTTHR